MRWGTLPSASDSRRVAFYLWRDVLNARPLGARARYALLPAYGYAAWALAAQPRAETPPLVPRCFALATALVRVAEGS